VITSKEEFSKMIESCQVITYLAKVKIEAPPPAASSGMRTPIRGLNSHPGHLPSISVLPINYVDTLPS
jgi:hypothetical protein